MWPFSKKKFTVHFYNLEHSPETLLVRVKLGNDVVSEQHIDAKSITAVKNIIREYTYAKLRYQRATPSASSDKQQSSIWHVLGCMPTTDKTKIESAFRKMAMVYHPDHGGSSTAFQTLVAAKEKALAKCN